MKTCDFQYFIILLENYSDEKVVKTGGFFIFIHHVSDL